MSQDLLKLFDELSWCDCLDGVPWRLCGLPVSRRCRCIAIKRIAYNRIAVGIVPDLESALRARDGRGVSPLTFRIEKEDVLAADHEWRGAPFHIFTVG